tara:strand:- start:1352 stop:3202 length:1851 start_codon:yes stop_codon:yes gene_type:complete
MKIFYDIATKGRSLFSGARSFLTRRGGKSPAGVRAPGRRGRSGGGAGFGTGALMGGALDSNQGFMGAGGGNNVIPFRGGNMGGVRGGQDHMATAAQATSALQDGDSSNPVVNQLQDIKEILTKIQGNTVTMAAGLTGVDTTPQPPDESAVKASFGGKSGSGGMGAGGAAGLGALAALLKLGLFGGKGKFGEESETEGDEAAAAALEEQRKNIEERLLTLEGGDMTLANAAKSTAMLGTRIRNRVVEGQRGFLNVENPMNTFRRARDGAIDASKVQIKPQGVDTAGQMVVADGPDAGKPVVESKKGNLTVAGADGGATTNTIKPDNVKIQAPNVGKKVLDQGKLAMAFARNMGEYGLKQLPLVGAVAGAGMAMWRLFQGDKAGAAAELGGVFIPSIAGGLTVDAGLLARDMYNDVFGDPDSKDPKKKFPHDTDMNTEGSGYGENYAMILDFVKDKLRKIQEGWAESAEPVEPRPKKKTGQSRRNQDMKQLAEDQKTWDEKFGNTHNPDGSPKDMDVGMDVVETDVSANLSTPTEPKDAVGGSSQIELTTSENAIKMEQTQSDKLSTAVAEGQMAANSVNAPTGDSAAGGGRQANTAQPVLVIDKSKEDIIASLAVRS